VSDIQRSRLLAATVGAVEELGYSATSVASITERARVSRRTFYDLFENREECMVAVLEGAVAQVTVEIGAAKLDDATWRERVRGGLWVILSFLDREPALARMGLVQSQRAGQPVLEYRQEVFDRLVAIVDEGRTCHAGMAGLSKLTAQGLVGAVLTILQSRLLDSEGEALTDLLGELTATIVLPYLGVRQARQEQARPAPPPVPLADRGEDRLTATLASVDPLASIPMRLTRRTALVLQDVAQHPGSSNRQISGRTHVQDQGQMSKLLARLERFGLLVNRGKGQPAKGEPNEWKLTTAGEQITRSILAHMGNGGDPGAVASIGNRGVLPSKLEEEIVR
jgi:AcrR family transcriptional regulator/DNA-binding MarR family transcriptional regulator